MEVFLVVAVVAVLFVVGVALQNSSQPTIPPVGNNNTELAECAALCNQWDTRRQERCNAEAAEASARAVVNSLAGQLAILLATAAALWIAYFAALSNPFTVWLGPILWVAAMAATAAADIVAGRLFVANIDAGNKATNAQNARNAEAAARSQLISRCPNDQGQVDACLLRPSPC